MHTRMHTRHNKYRLLEHAAQDMANNVENCKFVSQTKFGARKDEKFLTKARRKTANIETSCLNSGFSRHIVGYVRELKKS